MNQLGILGTALIVLILALMLDSHKPALLPVVFALLLLGLAVYVLFQLQLLPKEYFMSYYLQYTDRQKYRQEVEEAERQSEQVLLDESAMLEELDRLVIGQSHVKVSLVDAVRAYAQLPQPGACEGTFLFVGPPGVGKGEMSKALAAVRYGDPSAIITLRCNTLRDQDFGNYFGVAAGYHGNEKTPIVVGSLRRCSEQVIFFDEADRGPREVEQVLLSATGEGFIPDFSSSGPNSSTTDGIRIPRCLVVMTSNARKDELLAALHDPSNSEPATLDAKCRGILRGHFPDELLSRISVIFIFDFLSQEEIAELCIKELRELSESRQISITHVDPGFLTQAYLFHQQEPELGVRRLSRWLRSQTAHVIVQAEHSGISEMRLNYTGGQLCAEPVSYHEVDDDEPLDSFTA